ncbi:ribosomal RNA-processing protein 12, partial [Phenoliferia sp. Uapishka_3]
MATIDDLPVELLHLILQLSHDCKDKPDLDPQEDALAYDEQFSRSISTLLAASLVADKWRRPAQCTMWRYLLLTESSQVDRLLASPLLGRMRTPDVEVVGRACYASKIGVALGNTTGMRTLAMADYSEDMRKGMVDERWLGSPALKDLDFLILDTRVKPTTRPLTHTHFNLSELDIGPRLNSSSIFRTLLRSSRLTDLTLTYLDEALHKIIFAALPHLGSTLETLSISGAILNLPLHAHHLSSLTHLSVCCWLADEVAEAEKLLKALPSPLKEMKLVLQAAEEEGLDERIPAILLETLKDGGWEGLAAELSYNIKMLEAFDKVRLQANSTIAAVRKPATLLVAIEQTLPPNSPPSAYLVALTSTLDQVKPKQDPTLHCAVLYLLSLLVPTLEGQLLQPHAPALLATVDPLFKSYATDAPPLKSLLSIASALLIASPLVALSSGPTAKRVFTSILLLTVDGRPKVRRKAQEVIADVLASPPAPAMKHPYRQESSAWITEKLDEAVRGAKRSGEGDEARAIALLVFVKNLGASWDPASTPQLMPLVLASLTLSSPHLTLTALTLLSHLFSASNEEQNTPEAIEETLDALVAAKPKGGMGTEGGEKLLAGWVEGVGEGVVALARVSAEKATKTTSTIFPALLAILPPSTNSVLRASVETALALLIRHCITDAEILALVSSSGAIAVDGAADVPGSTLASIIELLSSSLTNTRYAGPSLPHLLTVLKALFLRLRLRVPGSSTTAASTLLRPTLTTLAQLRTTHQFEWKKHLDDVLSTSIQVCGPEAFLEILPLDLLPSPSEKKKAGEWTGGRAFLLPLLKPAITNTSLAHFKSHFIPLSSSLFTLSAAAKAGERTLEAKIYDTLIDQIWALLPGYCTYPLDVTSAFSLEFLNTLTTILYSTPSLRQPILRALQLLLSTTTSLASSQSPPEILFAQFGLTPEEGRKDLAHLQSLSPTVLGVSFNVYTQLDKSEAGSGVGMGVLAVIKDWSAALGADEREGVWSKIEGLLKTCLEDKEKKEEKEAGVEIGLLDISLALIPEKGQAGTKGVEGLKSMFELARSESVLGSKDQGVQKRGYRILNRLVEAGVIGGEGQAEKAGEVIEALVERGGKVNSGAKRDRTALLASLVAFLPPTALHHLPSLLPEAVLNTKESNERTREAAYDLLVLMGRKMEKGGVLDRTKVRGMDGDVEVAQEEEEDAEAMAAEDNTPVEANLDEFIKMVSAGLAASSPHMISATITSLSRLVFEFHSSLPQETLTELLSTLIIFLSSASREIVRSAIGYVKVALVSLPASLVAPSLPTLVPALLNWSHEHSNHFKVKIRHLLERFIKKFGIDAIERECPEDDRKLITNIRKRVMRTKKKKTKQAEEDAENDMVEDEPAPKPQVGGRSAYDEVIYGGSDSEDSGAGSDDDGGAPAPTAHNRKTQAKKNKARGEDNKGTFIHEADGEVLDLLDDRMMSRISAARPTATARKPLASHFKTDDSGRMQIDDEVPKSRGGAAEAEGGEGMGAYLEAMRGEDGHTRDAKGRTRFNKTQGKRSRGDEEGEESVVEGLKELEVTEGAGRKRVKKVKRESVKIGGEFKAKNAGGDVARNGMNPYAYVPLQSVAGKNKSSRGPKMDITGKKGKK